MGLAPKSLDIRRQQIVAAGLGDRAVDVVVERTVIAWRRRACFHHRLNALAQLGDQVTVDSTGSKIGCFGFQKAAHVKRFDIVAHRDGANNQTPPAIAAH